MEVMTSTKLNDLISQLKSLKKEKALTTRDIVESDNETVLSEITKKLRS